MKVLFLHGKESKPGGTKPSYLAQHRLEVLNPALPDDDFDAAVRIAQTEFDLHKPDVVVGSSRGGAVAINANTGDVPLVLLAPAWKTWGAASKVGKYFIVLHSKADDVVPFCDSEELLRNSGNHPHSTLIEIGSDHRLSTPEALAALLVATRAASIPRTRRRVTPADLRAFVFIEWELLRDDLSPERRSELCEERGGIGEAYAHDWLWDEPELRDDPNNPRFNPSKP